MFEEHNWEIPKSWEELKTLCKTIKSEGVLPFSFGFKDIWTCLAPWNAMAVDLSPADTPKIVIVSVAQMKFSSSKEEQL